MQPALIFFMGSRHFQVLSILNKLQWVRKDCRRLQIDVCELRFRLYILWCIDSMLISFHSCTDRSRKCCRSPPRLVVIRLYEWGQRLQSAHCYRDSSDVLMRLSPSSNPDRPPPPRPTSAMLQRRTSRQKLLTWQDLSTLRWPSHHPQLDPSDHAHCRENETSTITKSAIELLVFQFQHTSKPVHLHQSVFAHIY